MLKSCPILVFGDDSFPEPESTERRIMKYHIFLDTSKSGWTYIFSNPSLVFPTFDCDAISLSQETSNLLGFSVRYFLIAQILLEGNVLSVVPFSTLSSIMEISKRPLDPFSKTSLSRKIRFHRTPEIISASDRVSLVKERSSFLSFDAPINSPYHF